jgi:hypothetical protein
MLLSFCLVVSSALVVTACSGSSSAPAATSTNNSGSAPAADQKSGTTTKTGVLTAANGSFFLQEPGDSPRVVESYTVELTEYVGQTVTVTGQYSGDTLFIGSIE